jgi:hypothetical protein
MPAPVVDQSPWSGAGIYLTVVIEARPALVSRLS